MQHFTKLWIFGLLLFSPYSFAYENHHQEEWELGLSVGYASLPDEDAEGTNVHLHVMKHLEGEGYEYFSLGLGLEMIASEDTHYATMFTIAVHPTEDLTFSISPSLVWEKHDEEEWEHEYATHLELSYVFDVSEHFHIGPVIGYSKSSEAEHYTFGIHLGIPL